MLQVWRRFCPLGTLRCMRRQSHMYCRSVLRWRRNCANAVYQYAPFAPAVLVRTLPMWQATANGAKYCTGATHAGWFCIVCAQAIAGAKLHYGGQSGNLPHLCRVLLADTLARVLRICLTNAHINTQLFLVAFYRILWYNAFCKGGRFHRPFFIWPCVMRGFLL